jgi:hypothetical protein
VCLVSLSSSDREDYLFIDGKLRLKPINLSNRLAMQPEFDLTISERTGWTHEEALRGPWNSTMLEMYFLPACSSCDHQPHVHQFWMAFLKQIPLDTPCHSEWPALLITPRAKVLKETTSSNAQLFWP